MSEKRNLVTAMSIQVKAEIIVYGRGTLRGWLYSQYLEEPYEFINLFSMLERMEELFDTEGFPEAFLSPRTFGGAKPGAGKRGAISGDAKREAERDDFMKGSIIDTVKPTEKHDSGGTKCTFEIAVKFRQNATWQGQILWAEKNMKQNFRSVLEMLKLMDEAITDSSVDRDPVQWGIDEGLE